MKSFHLFRRTTGLNTIRDPAELVYDPATATVELAIAVNVDVERSGRRKSRRKGRTLLQAGEFHSGFPVGSQILCVQEYPTWASLFLFDPQSNAFTGIRSGLSKHRFTAYCDVNQQVYYSNGVENGIYANGVSAAWAMQAYSGPDTDLEFYDPPVASIIAVMGGFMMLAEGPIIWISEEFDYAAYNLANRYLDLVDDVTMIAPVADGAWVGTRKETLFMAGTTPALWQVAIRMAGGVRERSRSHRLITGTELGFDKVSANGYTWISDYGVCWGGPGGQIINLTEKRIHNADLAGVSGYCQLVGSRLIASIDP
ncbi:MAG TPA: hypothetical protein DCE18_19525 [Syntrophobacteraceae bacterium]|jgi:hypothetical protein|nr:hypothetical protein [Syntrophobacteraceae bacterium]